MAEIPAWSADAESLILDERFGPWVQTESQIALAKWGSTTALYELWVKPGINRNGRAFGTQSFQA